MLWQSVDGRRRKKIGVDLLTALQYLSAFSRNTDSMTDFKIKQIDSSVDFSRLEWWDVVIIGAGPAGLAAGLTAAHRALTTLIVEAKDSHGG